MLIFSFKYHAVLKASTQVALLGSVFGFVNCFPERAEMAEWGQSMADKNLSNFRLTHTFPSCHNKNLTEVASAPVTGGDPTLERLLGVQLPKGSIFPVLLGSC